MAQHNAIMPGVLVVWAKLPEEAVDWYEHDYVPDMREQFATYTLHTELMQTGLDGEAVGTLSAPWPLCAVYEVIDAEEATRKCYNERNHPPQELFKDTLADSCFDVRTYKELKKWVDEDWEADGLDTEAITSIACLELHVPKELQDEVLDYYINGVAPLVAAAPEVLRLRLMEVDNAIQQRGEYFKKQEKDAVHTYFVLVELEGEDWPWDVVVELSTQEKWMKWFEKQDVVKWSLSQYLVKKVYGDGDKPRTAS